MPSSQEHEYGSRPAAFEEFHPACSCQKQADNQSRERGPPLRRFEDGYVFTSTDIDHRSIIRTEKRIVNRLRQMRANPRVIFRVTNVSPRFGDS